MKRNRYSLAVAGIALTSVMGGVQTASGREPGMNVEAPAGKISTDLALRQDGVVVAAINKGIRSRLARSNTLSLVDSNDTDRAEAGAARFHIWMETKSIPTAKNNCGDPKAMDASGAPAVAISYHFYELCFPASTGALELAGGGLLICDLSNAETCAQQIFEEAESSATSQQPSCERRIKALADQDRIRSVSAPRP